MANIRILLSLTTDDNDYQLEQATTATEMAKKFGCELKIIYAKHDAIHQGQQLLSVIQGPSADRPDAIICEPVGTAMEQIARVSVNAGIAWVLLNRSPEYLDALRRLNKAPIFAVTTDQKEIGRIHARQIARLLPEGGNVLYLQGPASVPAAQERSDGLMQAKPHNIQLRAIRSNWTEQATVDAVKSWLALSTSHQSAIHMVVGQSDSHAIGARRAFEANTSGDERARWQSLPYLGCDACLNYGQRWLREGLMKASIVLPRTAGVAIQMFAELKSKGVMPPEQTIIKPESRPTLDELAAKTAQASV